MAKQRRGHQERPTGAHPRDTCRQFPAPGGLGPPLLAEPRLCPCLLSVVKRPKPAKTQLTGCPLAPPGSRWGRHMAQINAWVSHRECRTRARGWRGRAVCRGCWGLPTTACVTGRAPRSTIFWSLRPTTAVQTTQRCYLCLPAATTHGTPWPSAAWFPLATLGPRPENDEMGAPDHRVYKWVPWHTAILGALWCPYFGKQPHTPAGPARGPGRYRWGK